MKSWNWVVGIAVALPALTGGIAFAQGSALNLGPIKPLNPGFGQTAQFSVYLSERGKPVKNASIECWFSGIKGIRTSSWFVRTNNEGRATFTQTLPRNWKGASWVDLNASCDQVAALNLWRVRGK